MLNKSNREKNIYFQLVGGAAGDMLLASLLDLGCPLNYLKKELSKLNIPFQLEIKNNLGAYHVNKKEIIFKGPRFSNYKLVKRTINKSLLTQSIKNKIKETYEYIVAVESKVHKTKDVHFHHLGDIDAILEISGFFIALDYLNINRIYVSSIPLSNPAPATLELLKNKVISNTNNFYETITPTAAALLFNAEYREDNFIYEKYGIGWGKNHETDYLIVYVIKEGALKHDKVIKIETNIDDMNPQCFELLMDKLYQAGAKEVYIEQVIMKKSRPAFVVNVLGDKSDFSSLRDILFKHTTTFGVRFKEYNRDMLNCKFIRRKTKFGNVSFRVSNFCEGKVMPEYKDCKKIAQANNIPILKVYEKLVKEI